jgi:hypothetical protein
VRFDRTGVLKGFMIFLIATGWLVNSSLAELFVWHHGKKDGFSDG